MDDKTKSFFKSLVGNEAETEKTEENEEKKEEIEIKPAKRNRKKEIKTAGGNEKKEESPKIMNTDPEEEFDEGEGQLLVDVYQTPEEIVVQSAVAGVSQDNLDIDITNESVTIRGRRPREEKVREEDYLYRECYWGRFSRSIILPQEIDAERAAASLKNGVLTIRLPKLGRQKSKKLKVKFE